MNITFFNLDNHEETFVRKHLKGHRLSFEKEVATPRVAKKYSSAQAIGLFVMSKITKDVLDQLPSLKLIITLSTGYDHIDLEEVKKRGIRVYNVPLYGQRTVAEHTLALLFALNRRLIPGSLRTRKFNFDFRGLEGFDLYGKTIGVIGTGNIGQNVIRFVKAFGMKVLAYDAFPSDTLAKKLGFRYVRLSTLCKRSDFISLHLPLLPETKGIIGKKEFSLMKKDVQIINTSRGSLIDPVELLHALDNGAVRGAALDVLDHEHDLWNVSKQFTSFSGDVQRLDSFVQNVSLLRHPNVIVTPHLGFYTDEAIERILQTSIDNISRFQKNIKTNRVV